MGGMETHVNRILYMTSLSLTCSSYDPLSGHVFQCLVRSSMDHRAESHRVCSAASVMFKYGQQSRSHARASWFPSHNSLVSFMITRSARALEDQSAWSSHTSLVSLMITRSARALEDQFAWSSRTSLATLMSGARASS